MISVLTHVLRMFNKSLIQSSNFECIVPLLVKYDHFGDKADCDLKFNGILDLYQSKHKYVMSGY